MKAIAALGVSAILLLASPAISQVPDDKLIVPGQRIGKWTLDMTLDDLDRMNGQGALARMTERGFQSAIVFRAWPDFGLLAAHRRDQMRVEALIISILISTSGVTAFKTAEGIGISSKWEEVLSAYRRPSWETRVAQSVIRSVYDQNGITFMRLIDSEGKDTVVAFYVFRPGAARSIWR